MSGKGSKRRPQQASDAEVQASWDRIFSGGAEETRKNTAAWVAENEPDMTKEKVEESLGRMNIAPLMFGGWRPSAEQRRTAEHFCDIGDIFDLLGL